MKKEVLDSSERSSVKCVSILELRNHPERYAGKKVRVQGWAKTIRDQKNFAFISLADGSTFSPLQLVVSQENFDNYSDLIKQGTGTAYDAVGLVVLTPNAKQPMELQVETLYVEGACPANYPLQPKRHSLEFLRTIAHLRPRANLMQAVFRVRSEAAFAIHSFFNQRGFIWVHTPIITTSDAEGAGEMFRVSTIDPKNPPLTEAGTVDYTQDFFGKQTHLTVSGQLNGETFAQAFKNIYTFGPTFRAEQSNTSRHAAEFWMIEPEIAFADLKDNMELAESMLKYIIRYVLERCADEMQFFNSFVDKDLIDRLETVLKSDFRQITYTEAVELLQASGQNFKFPIEWGADLQTEHERYLTEKICKGPVFVTDYPADIKAFYMRINEDGKTVAAMDCLVPGVGEIIGGSQREERLDYLERMIQAKNLEPKDYEWYLDLRRFGSTKHAGFGLGFERLIMYLTGVSNIRDVIPYPRTYGSAMH